jgi:hypothetical protein
MRVCQGVGRKVVFCSRPVVSDASRRLLRLDSHLIHCLLEPFVVQQQLLLLLQKVREIHTKVVTGCTLLCR